MVHKITFVIIAWAVVLTCGQNVDEDPQPLPGKSSTASPNSTTLAPTTPTTPTTSTTPTTPTTSTTPPTTPTTPSTPTTQSTTVTTTAPYPHPTTNTPEPTTPTPTPKPSPTTPTPTPSPKPPQKPDVGKWNVTDDSTNVTCILVDMAIQFNISYFVKDNKTKHIIVNVPKDAVASGSCGNTSQVLDLDWKENNKSFGHLNLAFLKNETTKHFMISVVNLTVASDDKVFPDILNDSNIVLLMKKDEFSTPVSKSYRCEKEQSFVLKRNNGTNETNSEMSVSHVQLEAFHTQKDAKFGAAEDCESSSSTDIVPIAVGCALVGLVAIVLIAYLVGRRRSQARGYLSM